MPEGTNDPGKKGTALVTGASSGIGEAFCRALAGRGHPLVMVARRREGLESLAKELSSRHGISAETLPADLSTEEGMESVAGFIARSEDLEVLVNSAGDAIDGHFDRTDVRRQMESVRLHDLAVVRLTHAALPGMKQRRRGDVINLSSMAAFFPFPGSAVYSACKAFTAAFTETLALELRGTGVRVQALCPGFTHTQFHQRMGMDVSSIPEWMWMNPEEVVAESLRALERGRVICIPGRLNRLMAASFRLPQPLLQRGSWMLYRLLELSRSRRA